MPQAGVVGAQRAPRRISRVSGVLPRPAPCIPCVIAPSLDLLVEEGLPVPSALVPTLGLAASLLLSLSPGNFPPTRLA